MKQHRWEKLLHLLFVVVGGGCRSSDDVARGGVGAGVGAGGVSGGAVVGGGVVGVLLINLIG